MGYFAGVNTPALGLWLPSCYILPRPLSMGRGAFKFKIILRFNLKLSDYMIFKCILKRRI